MTPADLKPHLALLLGNLLSILDVKNKTPQQLAENDYVMKGEYPSILDHSYFFDECSSNFVSLPLNSQQQ